MIKAATRLYGRGFAILWLKPRSKMPIMAKWTSGPRQTLTELKKQYRPGMNMGVRLGAASKVGGGYLAVIDVDVKDSSGKSDTEIAEELKRLKIPGHPGKGLKVWSGRGNGSHHIYIKTPKPVAPKRLARSETLVRVMMPSVSPSRREKAEFTLEELEQGWRLRPAWEISLMGEGQQVVLPPSIHPDSGQEYKWNTDGEHTIPLFDVLGGSIEKQKKEKIQDFKPVPYDLITCPISEDVYGAITEGTNVEDRSASVFGASIALKKAGFSDLQILSALTDEENYLGQVAYDHAKTKSRKRAAEWVLNFTLKKAGKVANAKDDFEVVDASKVEVVDKERAAATLKSIFPADGSDWKTKIERDHREGRPKANFKNIKLILKGVMGDRKFLSFNEFSLRITWLLDTKWECKKGQEFNGKNDCIRIKNYLVHNFRMDAAVERIMEVVIQIAQENSFHPVREYLDGLEWDGRPRLDNWLISYLGAYGAPAEYLQAVGRKVLTAMIARIMRPGCEFAYVMVLEGKQRIGKSAAARILGGEWFADTTIDIRKVDAMQSLQGVWVYEIAELAQFTKADINHLKNYISSSQDRIRVPYGTHQVNYPRQSVFIGTTNDEQYLQDKTGNSRFWPVKFGDEKLDRDLLKKDRDQLLAEAKFVYELGEKIWMDTPELERLAEVQQKLRMKSDDLEGPIAGWIADSGKDEFTIFDIIQARLQEFEGQGGRMLEWRIGDCLRNLGFFRFKKRTEKGLKWMWKKAPKNGVKNAPKTV